MQSIQEENERMGEHMVNIVKTLVSVFERGVYAAFPDISVAVVVTPAAQEKFGDYQCNSAMNIAQVCLAADVLYELCIMCDSELYRVGQKRTVF